MKNSLLIFFGLFLVINSNFAQTASTDSEIMTEAKKIAEASEDIQVWECKKSGNVTFVKSVADTDGTSKFVQVFYNENSKSFAEKTKVANNIAPSKGATCSPKDASCAPKSASCNSAKETTDQVQTNTAKKSCSKASSNSSCCASKKANRVKTQ